MRALLSVWDKTGLVEFATGPRRPRVWSSSPRAAPRAPCATAGVAHLDVADVTGFPEMLGGRVKTLHPAIHGGHPRRPRPSADHLAALVEHDIAAIDLVVCNLYPFSSDPSIELIDIGGPTMVRAAAKNHQHVGVVTSPAAVRGRCSTSCATSGTLSARHAPRAGPRRLRPHRRLRRADRALARHRRRRSASARARSTPWCLPTLHLTLERAEVVRYGENPHQIGARYRVAGHHAVVGRRGPARRRGPVATSTSSTPTPRGASCTSSPPTRRRRRRWPSSSTPTPRARRSRSSLADAFAQALAADPQSAFGGIVAVGGPDRRRRWPASSRPDPRPT